MQEQPAFTVLICFKASYLFVFALTTVKDTCQVYVCDGCHCKEVCYV